MDSNIDASLTIELNNAAASLISAGNFDKAISALGKALHSSRQIMVDANDRSTPLDLSLDQCMAQSPIADDESNEENETMKGFIYRRPIHMGTGIPPLCYESGVLASIIIIFNLALAYQLAAEDSNKRERYLMKAARLYELAHNFHSEEDFESSTFVLASVNNLGLIYQEFDDKITAQTCFQHLLSTLMLIVDCGQTDGSKLGGFFRNTSHLFCLQTTAAAA
jgi:tetratricopeptide (TPR) repeat protein